MNSSREEKIIRESIREILIQEGFLDSVWGGLKFGAGKVYDLISGAAGSEEPKSGILKTLDDLAPDDAPFNLPGGEGEHSHEEDESSAEMASAIPGVTVSSGVNWTEETRDFVSRLRDILDPSIPLHITSAMRTPEEQARAMLKKYDLGGADEIIKVYGKNTARHFLSEPANVSSWTNVVLRLQEEGKGFTSQHLLGKAVDIRTRNLSSDQISDLVGAVEAAGGRPLIESNPPHLHVDKFQQISRAISENILTRNRNERAVRMLVRDVIIQEGLFDDIMGGIKLGAGKAFDVVSPYLGIEKPTTGILKSLDDLSDEDDHKKSAAAEEIKKAEILGHGNLVPGSSDVVDSWRGRLGTETGGGINFHKLEDGRNNYRGALDEGRTTASAEFFDELRKDYGIRTVVTLNADSGGRDIPDLVEEAGLESLYVPMGDNDWPSRESFEKIKSALREGNTLVHCTHGADRTGAVVGRYYIEDLGWDLKTAIDYTKKFGGHKLPGMKRFLINGPGGSPSESTLGSNKERGGPLDALDNVFSDYSDLFDS